MHAERSQQASDEMPRRLSVRNARYTLMQAASPGTYAVDYLVDSWSDDDRHKVYYMFIVSNLTRFVYVTLVNGEQPVRVMDSGRAGYRLEPVFYDVMSGQAYRLALERILEQMRIVHGGRSRLSVVACRRCTISSASPSVRSHACMHTTHHARTRPSQRTRQRAS
jgi:hypothetical protein